MTSQDSVEDRSVGWWPAFQCGPERVRRLGFNTVLLEPRFIFCVLDPSTGAVPPNICAQWRDRSLRAGGRRSLHRERKPIKTRLRDANTGAVTATYPSQPGSVLATTTLLPVRRQICCITKGWDGMNGIARWLRKDFSNGRPIWTPATVGDKVFRSIEGEVINVDPTGQWVAWDLLLEPRMNPRCIALNPHQTTPRRRQPH